MAENNQTVENKQKLHVNMLGSVSLTYNGNTINSQMIRSKKFWLILEYLIAFRNRDISQIELIDLIYPEGKSENPANALKTLIHRIRSGLDHLNYMDSHDMIVYTRGTYAWNTKMDCVIDVEEFDKLCKRGNATVECDDEKLDYYLKAIELYNGDLLHKSAFEPWAVQLNVYYRTLYKNIVHKAINILKQKNEHNKIIDLCERALTIDSFDENLYYNLILGLVNIKDSKRALTEYRKMTTLFYREFGVTPSKETMKLYKEVIKTSKEVETDLNVIKEHLKEEPPEKGPFFCEYEVFKDIYRTEVRAASRTGESVYLCLLTLSSKSSEVPAAKLLHNYMDKLRGSICETFRRGDIFAQYSVSQFILLLPLTTYENGEKAVKRLLKQFNKHYPYCPYSVIYSLQAIEIPSI